MHEWNTSANSVTLRSRHDEWDFRLVILDLDGTITKTYASFAALDKFAMRVSRALGDSDHTNVLDTIAEHVKEGNLVQYILHRTHKTISDIEKALWDTSEHCLSKDVQDCINESFTVFSGAVEFLERAKKAGTAVVIYTNTNPEDTANRLKEAKIDPGLIYAIYSKVKNPDYARRWRSTSDSDFKDKFIFYSSPKPNCQPVKDLANQFRLCAEEILFVGDGASDFGCVLEDPKDLKSKVYATFALQEEGAKHAGDTIQINRLLRGETHPLGLEHFKATYPDAHEHRHVFIFHKGFKSLLKMMDCTKIKLSPTPNLSASPAEKPVLPSYRSCKARGTTLDI